MTVIVLQRDNLVIELEVKNTLAFSGKLGRMAYEGWQVVECRGQSRSAELIRQSIIEYKADPKGYRVPIASTVKAGCAEAGADFEKVKKQFKKRFGVKVE